MSKPVFTHEDLEADPVVEVRKYRVNFTSCNAEVEAKDESEAEELAKELLYNGELSVEVESIEEI